MRTYKPDIARRAEIIPPLVDKKCEGLLHTDSKIPRISILLPTRKRPDMLLRMLSSLFDTAKHPEMLEVVVYIDDDDTSTLELGFSSWNVKRIVGPRQSMGKLNAACYAQSTGEVIILCNDDIIVRTKGWDMLIHRQIVRFPDEVYLLYPNDLYKGRRLAVFPILSRVTCDTIGDPFPADYRGAFIDVHVLDIFKQLQGRGHKRVVFLEDVVFEHMHYKLGKSVFDSTYRERNRFGDDRTFMLLINVRSWAAERLNALIEGVESTLSERLGSFRPAGGWFLRLTLNILSHGSSPLFWRLRLFAWLWLRFIYRNVKIYGRKILTTD